MSYNFGMPANWAANLPFHVKNGLVNVVDRGMIDDALPNNFQFFAVNPDGDGKIPYLIAVDTNGMSQLNNPGGVKAYAIQTVQLSTPADPTITNAGTAGSTTDAYKIVAYSGYGDVLGSTPASGAGTTTTANATLSTSNYNVITWAAVAGASFYKVFRTTAAGTPSSTGAIATVPATIDPSTQVQTASYSLDDTGLAGDGSTAPTTNTTGAVSFPVVLGGISIPVLATPTGLAIAVNGTAGVTSVGYKVVALAASGHTAASSEKTTTTANATLSSTNSLTLTWQAVPGAAGYQIYRTTAAGTPSTTGLVGTVDSDTLTFTDTGIAGDSSTAPSTNTTGGLTLTRLDVSGTQINAKAINYVTAGGSANAITVTLQDASGTNVPQVAGLRLTVNMGSVSLQAGANTLALNGASAANIKKASDPSTNLTVAIAAAGIVDLVFDGTSYLALGA